MCGICGVVDSKGAVVEKDLIHRMCSAMVHRGPDDEGMHLSSGVGLGHRRLSIIDLSASGHQPMSNEDGSIWIVLNGEIYNYKELRKALEDKGHRFRSNTDTEVIVHLYEEHGEDLAKYLRGMFAFAIWDEKRKTLLLARDRVGKKPLVYHYKNGRLSFASEFSSLLASGLVQKRVNQEALHYYMTFGYVPAPLSIYEGIFKLLPAHLLILKDDTVSIRPYWQLNYSEKINIDEVEAASEVLRLLKESVKIRLYSDVPLGAFLSGGIDSSTVVALMSQVSNGKVKTFSIGFAEKDYSELKYAKNIAERFNTEHHEFIVKPNALEVIPKLVDHYGEPYADSSCIPTYYVSQQTRQHVTVALNGDGGDELFAGYDRYKAMLISEAYHKLPAPILNRIHTLTGLLPDSIDPKDKIRRIRRFFDSANLPTAQRYLRWVGIFNNKMTSDIYSHDFCKKVSGYNSVNYLSPFFYNSNGAGLLDCLLNADTSTYLPNDLLVKVDIASMANSLEARSPFLDHKLIEFAASLPVKYKMRNLVKKYILKKAIKGLVPAANINRPKMGFGVPVGVWFRGELKDFLRNTILSKPSLDRGYFKPEAISKMYELHTNGQKDYEFQLWALLMLELWHRRFID